MHSGYIIVSEIDSISKKNPDDLAIIPESGRYLSGKTDFVV
jgi:hypothetical protein